MAERSIDGILNIGKPAGMTSHDVVARVRRLLRESVQSPKPKVQSKVGHAGTLDPIATGVLPVVVGKATRLVEYLADADKAYRATLILGATSDTYDREGTVTPTPNAAMPSIQEIEHALEAFKGEIEQLPPMHSAVKVGGKKLYELARQGVEIERKPRRVTITRLEVEEYEPPALQLFVECSKGTYIRSLAHDLGQALGTGAYLDALVRTRHGPFTLEGAVTLEALEAAFKGGTWQESLYPPEHILAGWKTHVATPEEERDVVQGKPLRLPPPAEGERPMMVAKTGEGELLAVLYWDEVKESWCPRKVFAAPPHNSSPRRETPPKKKATVSPLTQDEVEALWQSLDWQDFDQVVKHALDTTRGNPVMREWAVWALQKINDNRVIEPLIAVASNPDEAPEVRHTAIQALVSLRATEAVTPLLSMLADNDDTVRRAAAAALGWLGDDRAVEPLLQLLSHPDGKTRRAALSSLGFSKDPRILEPLVAVLVDKKSGRQRRIVAARNLGRLGDKRAIEPLLRVVADKDSHQSVVRSAIHALGELGDARAARLLRSVALNKEQSADARCDAVQALSKMETPGLGSLLLDMMQDDDESEDVRRCAISALGDLKVIDAVEPIIKALNHNSINIVWSAIAALGRIGGDRAVEALLDFVRANSAYREKTSPLEPWLSAVEELGELGDARAIEPLRAILLRDGGLDYPHLVALSALSKLRDKSVFDILISLLGHDEPLERAQAAHNLGYLGDERAIEPLINALDDEDQDVRCSAAEALGWLGAQQALPKLLEMRARMWSQLTWEWDQIDTAIHDITS